MYDSNYSLDWEQANERGFTIPPLGFKEASAS
jgi:hypothetical protein